MIRKDFDFVMRVLKNKDNKIITLPHPDLLPSGEEELLNIPMTKESFA